MIDINYDTVVTEKLLEGNVDNPHFVEDYRVLHCLIRKYNPKRFLEVGCNMGTGTKVIKNAIGDGEVFSLDLPTELANLSLQHPINEGKGDNVGADCDLPFTLLRGDSLKFDYSSIYPINGWFIDGEHTYEHPKHEATEAIKSNAELIVFHDADMDLVNKAIEDAFAGNDDYVVYRVLPTRMAYAIKK